MPSTEPANTRAPDPILAVYSSTPRRDNHPTLGAPTRGRIRQIDVIKGLAIVGVMVQHAFTAGFLHGSWDTLWAGQAVPVFFVLMGLNAARSTARSKDVSLRGLYTTRYVRGRLDRLIVPLAVAWLIALPVATAIGAFHVGPLVVLGVLPIASAPGNYFVTIVLEFAVLFPAVYVCFTHAPVGTTIAILALDIAFELVAPHVRQLTIYGVGNGYVYEASILKYGTAIVAGMWLARLVITPSRALVLLGLAAVSFVYLIVLHVHPSGFSWLTDSFSRSTNFLSVFYAVWLTWMGLLRLTPRHWFGAYDVLERIGQASYHVFLVQIIWFGAITNRSVPVAIMGIVVCCVIGWLFYRAVPGAAGFTRTGPRRRSSRSARSAPPDSVRPAPATESRRRLRERV
jgi:peptidoglycan/LPS O-acetylase OafA/YrhL